MTGALRVSRFTPSFPRKRESIRVGRTLMLCALLTATSVAAQAPTNRTATPDLKALDQYVAKAAKDWHVPGLAIAVVHDDSLVFAKGYGVLELGKPTPVTEHTRFAIASTTKAMTVAALAMLVDEGKLSWDDRVIDHLPNFRLYDPWVTREFTIRDLLTHRSGLPNTDLLWYLGKHTFPEIMQHLRYVKPTTSFRTEFEYQNVMYGVAGAVVEQVSGMPWDAFVRTRIFAPLGMNESTTNLATIMGQPRVAVPHAEIRDTVRAIPFDFSADPIAAAGAVWSSVSDMSKWMRFVLDSGRVGSTRLIQPATFREIVAPEIRAPLSEYPALELAQPHFFSYAFGWFVQDYHGEIVWMHTGSIDGMSAIIGLLPAQRVGVYVLENLDHAELRHALMYKVFDMYEGNPPRDWSADVKALFARMGSEAKPAARATDTHPSLPLASYVGTYSDSAYGTVVVTLDNGGLRVQVGGEVPRDLEHWEYDTFRAREAEVLGDHVSATFVSDGNGHINAVRMFGVTFMRSRSPQPVD